MKYLPKLVKLNRVRAVRRLVVSAAVFAALLLVASLPQMAVAQVATWSGNASSAWNDAGNWDALPVSTNSLVFTSATGVGGLNLNNDLTDGTFSVAGITFDAGSPAYVIGDGTLTANAGNTFVLTGNVTNNSTSLQTINNPFSMTTVRTFTTTTGGGDITLAGNLSGTGGGITKTGAGTLTLSGANSYTGTTTISAGTLALTGGDNRLATAGTVNFSNNATLSIANNQTLSTVTVTNTSSTTSQTFTGTITGGGNLELTGGSFSIGATLATQSGNTIAQILNLSGLGSFSYNNSGGTFSVSGTPTGGNGVASGSVILPGVATITASSFGVGNMPHPSNGGRNQGTLTLGQTATINAATIQVGGIRANGTIQYSSVSNPTLTLRGSDGIAPVTTMTIGTGSAIGNTPYSGTVNLTTGVTGSSTLDAKITTLNMGYVTAYSGQNATYTGTLLMGNGTLDADTIYLGRNVAGGGGIVGAIGTLTVTGGTVKVNNLYLGDQNSSTATSTVNGTFNLNGGATLYAQTIDKGPGTGTQAATRTFNWNAGTIHNYDSSTDLTINNNFNTFALIGAGAHIFDISSGRQGTVHQVISGSGSSGLTKAGDGILVLEAANTYTGPTAINAGTLRVGGSGSINSSSGITINGGQLDYNSSTPLTAGLTFTNGTLGGTEWTGSSLNNLTIGANMAISPGNSPGTANTVDQEWANSGTYVWEINNATGTIGADPGWDLLSGTGNLTITATSGTPFTIEVTSLDLLNDPGDAANFDQSLSYNWRIADFASEISTFSLSAFAVNTTNFQNAFSGNFSVARGDTVGGDNTQLYLTYVPVPEPATLALLAAVGGLAGIGYSRRRRRA
jgi:autotransporter-associated beta strand protein